MLLPHFRGNLDNSDPALIDALVPVRRVVVRQRRGRSTGTTPSTIDAIAFLDAMEVE